MLRFEKKAWMAGHNQVAGIDEAGRGPLAGPVVAAAVAINAEYLKKEINGHFKGLNDSKKLTHKKREFFFEQLNANPNVCIGVGIIPVEIIDKHNILQATYRAMAEAVKELPCKTEFLLIDGLPVPGLGHPSEAIVKGDSKSLSIAAASIIAKVTRDQFMIQLDSEYPQYGFARHKGYGTAEHLSALRKHGATPYHRRSFRPVAQVLGLRPPEPEQLEFL